MVMPIEGEALEAVQNNGDLNIQTGRIAAYKALMIYLDSNIDKLEGVYVPDISDEDQRLQEMALTQYNSVRNAWIAMYENWNYPGYFVSVQGDRGAIYTQVSKHVRRSSDLSQATLW